MLKRVVVFLLVGFNTITVHWDMSRNEKLELSGLLTMGNRPLFKQRKRQFMRMWAPKVSGHGGVAHAIYKAEGPN